MLGKCPKVLTLTGSSLLLGLLLLPTAQAQDYVDPTSYGLPECLSDNGVVLPVNNAVVERWKVSTPNGFLARAHIRGPIIDLFADQTGHNHFGVQTGATPDQALEVIYSQDFGALPELELGMTIEACGDYITSTEATQRYPASPDRAILHWVHRSDTSRHQSGYVAVDGVIYGD